MRLSSPILTPVLLAGLAPAHAAASPPGCDSCAIEVDSLAEPTRLVGKWLSTREDSPANAATRVDASDTARWHLVKAPGRGSTSRSRCRVRFLSARTGAGRRPSEFAIVLPATFAVAS